jgi:hypothetical protein
MKAMMTFFAGILSVIAVGVLLIAYGLLSPRVATADGATLSRPMYASDRVTLGQGDEAGDNAFAARPLAYPVNGTTQVNGVRYVPVVETVQAPRRVATVSRPVSYQAERPVRVERSSGRDWKKTALIIGGSTAAGAGLGGIFGGKKGALIGAALGGGASTIYEVTKR